MDFYQLWNGVNLHPLLGWWSEATLGYLSERLLEPRKTTANPSNTHASMILLHILESRGYPFMVSLLRIRESCSIDLLAAVMSFEKPYSRSESFLTALWQLPRIALLWIAIHHRVADPLNILIFLLSSAITVIRSSFSLVSRVCWLSCRSISLWLNFSLSQDRSSCKLLDSSSPTLLSKDSIYNQTGQSSHC